MTRREQNEHDAMTVCKRVVYQGSVQGVGFRYTAQHLAHGFRVTGFVRNQTDGSVELVAQGPKDQVIAFLQALADRMADHIQEQTITDEATQDYQGFNIRF